MPLPTLVQQEEVAQVELLVRALPGLCASLHSLPPKGCHYCIPAELPELRSLRSDFYICIKRDTVMLTAFSGDTKESYFLTQTPAIHCLL